jgi:hypothetical protein
MSNYIVRIISTSIIVTNFSIEEFLKKHLGYTEKESLVLNDEDDIIERLKNASFKEKVKFD